MHKLQQVISTMELDKNQHSVYSINYHLVMVIKYRRKVISDEISGYLRATFERIGITYGVELVEWNHDKDHVHVLFKCTLQIAPAKFINAYKSVSSRLVKKNYPEIRQYLWKEAFWTKSYCLISTGEVSIDVIKQYIERQGQK